MKKYYTLGLNGFLLNKYKKSFISICNGYDLMDIEFERYQNILDFGCKCIDEYNYSLEKSLENTFNLINICKKYNLKYIFASSYGIYNPKTTYDYVKLAQEHMIQKLNNYLILRLPRIYDKTRTSGLMKFLRENPIYEDREIEYCTLDYFYQQFENTLICDSYGIIDFKTNRKDLISTIKKVYS